MCERLMDGFETYQVLFFVVVMPFGVVLEERSKVTSRQAVSEVG